LAFVYHGSATGLSATPDWTVESDNDFAAFGESVGTAGDVNGDGFADVIVGASEYDNGQIFEGGAFVYHGSVNGLSTTADWTAESDQAFAQFGISVGTAGDVNGDGYSDVIVGAHNYENGQTNEGRAFVYSGSAGGVSTTPDWTAEPNRRYAYFGYSVGSAGDVNADGYADVIVGAYGYNHGQSDEGVAFIHHGAATGLSSTPSRRAESNESRAFFGYSVGTAGDVNGDGYAELMVGAPDYRSGQFDEGVVFVWRGRA
jgi:hypothetical protein